MGANPWDFFNNQLRFILRDGNLFLLVVPKHQQAQKPLKRVTYLNNWADANCSKRVWQFHNTSMCLLKHEKLTLFSKEGVIAEV